VLVAIQEESGFSARRLSYGRRGNRSPHRHPEPPPLSPYPARWLARLPANARHRRSRPRPPHPLGAAASGDPGHTRFPAGTRDQRPPLGLPARAGCAMLLVMPR
jgi:hypothetical protein